MANKLTNKCYYPANIHHHDYYYFSMSVYFSPINTTFRHVSKIYNPLNID